MRQSGVSTGAVHRIQVMIVLQVVELNYQFGARCSGLGVSDVRRAPGPVLVAQAQKNRRDGETAED